MREDYIHFFARQFLTSMGWTLIAGQYPDGSDDELAALNVMDPELARDNSPDHRRHSRNKLVPDLVANKGIYLLVIEAKPRHDIDDERKLETMLTERRHDFLQALRNLVESGRAKLDVRIEELKIVPCLSFSSPKKFFRKPGFSYLFINDDVRHLIGNGLLPTELECHTHVE